MRRFIPSNPNSGPKVKRKAEPKLSIQLVPATQELQKQLKTINNPLIVVTLKRTKSLEYLQNYLFERYGVFKGAHLKVMANNMEWSNLETTLGDIYTALGNPEYFRLSYSFLFKIQLIKEFTNDTFELSIEQEKTLSDLTEMISKHIEMNPFLPEFILLKTENGWSDFSNSNTTITQLAEQLKNNLVLTFTTQTIHFNEFDELDDLDSFSFDLSSSPSSKKKRCHNEGCDSIGLFLCGNCKTTIYCSKSCQKSHWGKEHKTKCIQSSISASSTSSSSSSSGMGTQGRLRGIKTKGF